MSEKGANGTTKMRARKRDARIKRTHERLGIALIELILEKPIDSVTVQEVLDRASVGRSTFYLHFRGKDDLLFSQLEMFLERMSTMLSRNTEKSHRLVPVEEMLDHVGSRNRLYRALAESGRLPDFFDLAQEYFARGIDSRLKETNHPAASRSHLERTVSAIGLAGTLMSLFRWWIETRSKIPAAKMDILFHQIAWGAVLTNKAVPLRSRS